MNDADYAAAWSARRHAVLAARKVRDRTCEGVALIELGKLIDTQDLGDPAHPYWRAGYELVSSVLSETHPRLLLLTHRMAFVLHDVDPAAGLEFLRTRVGELGSWVADEAALPAAPCPASVPPNAYPSSYLNYQPSPTAVSSELFGSYLTLARWESSGGDSGAAMIALEGALRYAETLDGPFARANSRRCLALHTVARLMEDIIRADANVPISLADWRHRVLDLAERTCEAGIVANIRLRFGGVHLARGEVEEAVAQILPNLDELGDESTLGARRSTSMYRLQGMLRRLGDREREEALLLRFFEQEVIGGGDPAGAAQRLVQFYRLESPEDALPWAERLLALEPGWSAHRQLGELYARVGDLMASERQLELSLSDLRSRTGPFDTNASGALLGLASVYRQLGDVESRLQVLQEAEAMYEARASEHLSDINYEIHVGLGRLYRRWGRFEEAESQLAQAERRLRRTESFEGEDDFDLQDIILERVQLDLARGLRAEAWVVLERLIQQMADESRGKPWRLRRSLRYIAELFQQSGFDEEAELLLSRARGL